MPITIGGTVTLTIGQPGATSAATFTATAGQKVYAAATTSFQGNCGELGLIGPDGSKLESGCVIGRDGALDGVVLPTAGTYRVLLDPSGAATGSADIHLIADTDQTQSITIGGAPVTLTVAQPGAISTVTFTASAGQKITATFTSPQLNACGPILLYAPDNAEVRTACILEGTGSFDPTTLPATGTYRLVLDPYADTLGSVTMTLKAG